MIKIMTSVRNWVKNNSNYIFSTFTFACFLSLNSMSFAQDYPEPPHPGGIEERIYEKAGMGSYIPYARSGVLELGGSVSFMTANEFDQMSLNPTIGWFVADNLQLSAIASYNNVSTSTEDLTYWTLLAEPSYHLPFDNKTFGFVGLGFGVAYADAVGSGTALQPRLGANFLIGRSGILTPSVFVAYNTIDSFSVGGGAELLTVNRMAGFNLGYTVIW